MQFLFVATACISANEFLGRHDLILDLTAAKYLGDMGLIYAISLFLFSDYLVSRHAKLAIA